MPRAVVRRVARDQRVLQRLRAEVHEAEGGEHGDKRPVAHREGEHEKGGVERDDDG